jgi:thymidylate synthase
VTTYRNSSEALPALASQILNDGDEVGSRVGRVKELTFAQVTLTDSLERELLVPDRKPNLAAQIAETAWVLAGRDDIEWLSRYLPRAKDFSDDGEKWRGGYGPRIRNWDGAIDQLDYVVNLLREDPLTRRAVIQIYDPTIDNDPDGLDIPCNNWIHFLSRGGAIHAHVAVRSNDLMWGWSGINAFEWSALLEVVAGLVGAGVGSLTFSTSSLHLYDRHWAKARRIVDGGWLDLGELSPRFGLGRYQDVTDLDDYLADWFQIEANIRDGSVHPSQVNDFPDPMLRSWLQVLAWYWTGEESWLDPLKGTRLHAAAKMSYRPEPTSPFVAYVSKLHADKHAAYGDSWKRRGEYMIMANIARKVDRLGVAGAGDTAADTAIDLLVYLAKYRWWLEEFQGAPAPVAGRWSHPSDLTEPVNELIRSVSTQSTVRTTSADLERLLTEDFAVLETQEPERAGLVDRMLPRAYTLAMRLWHAEQNETRSWKGYEQ